MRLPVVGVMGSGTESWEPFSLQVGNLLAVLGVNLLTGGGGGTMEAVATAFVSSPKRLGVSIGVIPTEEVENKLRSKAGYPNKSIEICINSPLGVFDGLNSTQISRNHINILSSDVLIFLPGAKGTRNELELAKLYQKPFVLFGPIDFWEVAVTGNRIDDLSKLEEFVLAHI